MGNLLEMPRRNAATGTIQMDIKALKDHVTTNYICTRLNKVVK